MENGSPALAHRKPPRFSPLCKDFSKAIFSNVKSVVQGVSEYKIDFGPGYRIYLGGEGNTFGHPAWWGSKKTQSKGRKKSPVNVGAIQRREREEPGKEVLCLLQKNFERQF